MPANDYYKSIEQIAAGLAHEVKNPLSLVKANIDLLELADTEKSHEKSYYIMKREIEKINDLLLDFIQFAKPIKSNLNPFSLNEMMEELIETINSSLGGHIEIIYKTNAEFVLVADESKIRRVLFNIIKNAVEAIHDKGSETHGIIKIHMIDDIRNVQIIISDNGKGLSHKELEDTAQPFYTTKRGGSGLGLYICKTIIAEHQGEFEIFGQEGKGCTVRIKLPK